MVYGLPNKILNRMTADELKNYAEQLLDRIYVLEGLTSALESANAIQNQIFQRQKQLVEVDDQLSEINKKLMQKYTDTD